MVMTRGLLIQPIAVAVSARPLWTVAPTAATTGFAFRLQAAVRTASRASDWSCQGWKRRSVMLARSVTLSLSVLLGRSGARSLCATAVRVYKLLLLLYWRVDDVSNGYLRAGRLSGDIWVMPSAAHLESGVCVIPSPNACCIQKHWNHSWQQILILNQEILVGAYAIPISGIDGVHAHVPGIYRMDL